MSQYFPKPKSLETNVKVELDLSNYATKAYFKNLTRPDILYFLKKLIQQAYNMKLINQILKMRKSTNWFKQFES